MPRDVHDIKSQLIKDKRFEEIIRNLKDVHLPGEPTYLDSSELMRIVPEGRVTKLEQFDAYDLDYREGLELFSKDSEVICAYDESIASYEALEGRAVCTSHALVYVLPQDYLPVTYITLRFFTRSSLVKEKMGDCAVVAEDIHRESVICIAKDKMQFLTDYCINNSILLIDGPLIAGDAYTTFMPYIDNFCARNILSVFFVKNSYSNMVINNVEELSNKYNSDMHWCNEILKTGQRTAFYQYTDIRNPNNTKVFCYVKFYENTSPVRIEFPTKIFEKYGKKTHDVVNLAYYLLIVQGSKKNPQPRPIAIAEKYARETMKVIDVNRELHRATGLTRTMNEERWGNQ